MTEILAQRWDKTLSSLPPGAEVKNLWWSSRQVPGQRGFVNALATPHTVTVTLRYRGREEHYTETIELESQWMKLDSSSVSSDSTRGRLKQIAVAASALAKEQKKLVRAVGDLASSERQYQDPADVAIDPPIGSSETLLAVFPSLPAEPEWQPDGIDAIAAPDTDRQTPFTELAAADGGTELSCESATPDAAKFVPDEGGHVSETEAAEDDSPERKNDKSGE